MKFTRMITVVGAHAEGEVGRVITGGVTPPPGNSLHEQMLYLRYQADELRKLMLFEPRGGAFTHVNLIVPAKAADADAGFIIMEPDDYPPMSGSNSICVATVLLETGMVEMCEPETRLTLETPGGLVEVTAQCKDGLCERVTFTNVPCYAAVLDRKIDVKGIGELMVDVGYGGAFFAIVDAAEMGFALVRGEARQLVELGERIKQAAVEQIEVTHPENPKINEIVFTQFAGPIEEVDGVKTGRNAVVISPGKIDRSPCGTGTSARLAVMHAKEAIGIGEPYVSLSPIGTRFDAMIAGTCDISGTPGISPTISGRAWITGFHNYVLDPRDPFPQGYTLSDTWYRALD